MPVDHPTAEKVASDASMTTEQRYIVQRWRADRKILRWASLAAALLNPAGWATDLLIAGWGRTSAILFVLRLAAGIAALPLFWASRKLTPPDDTERIERLCVVSFALTVISGVLGPTLLRPTSVAAQGGPLLAIILLYSLGFPMWQRHKIFFSVLASALYVASGMIVRPYTGYGGKHELVTISIFLIAASVLGPGIITRIERLQRDVFSAREDLESTIANLRAESAERARQAEHLEQARREAHVANEAKSYFLASVSHDLRTPIAGILSTAELLADNPAAEDRAELLDALRASGRMLLAVVNDILDLSKLEAGKLAVEPLPVEIPTIVNNVCALLIPQAKGKGIELRADIDSNINRPIVTDPIRLQQILFNIVGNAVKFTAEGAVEVQVHLRTRDDVGHQLCIDVRDTGIGMDDQTMGRLFQPFAQADVSTMRKFGGTGLGLAISKRLVELLGGEISVTSAMGQGSTFSIVLPAQFGTTIATPAASVETTHRRLRILVAEDNEINAMIATRVLRSLNHEFVRVADGQAAVDRARDEKFDVILMDMQMPIMDGIDAVVAIRKLEQPSAKVPIIALTADAVEERRTRYFEAGIDGFLTKPYTRVELSAALEMVLKKRAAA